MTLIFVHFVLDVTEAQQTRYNVGYEEIEARRAFVRSVRVRSKQIADALEAPAVKEKNFKMQKDVYCYFLHIIFSIFYFI